MITPGIAASLTPTTIERPRRAERTQSDEQVASVAEAAPAGTSRRLRVPRLHLPGVHLPHGHA